MTAATKVALLVSRASLIASWKAASRQADIDGHVLLSPASAAGHLLEMANGSVKEALKLLPDVGEFGWWVHASRYLHALQDEEGA